MTDSFVQHPSMASLTSMFRDLGQRFIAFVTKRVNKPRQESGWYVNTDEADALTESNKYLQGVNVDAALDTKFDTAVQVVLDVNKTSPDSGTARLSQVRQAYKAKTDAARSRSQ